MNSKQRRSQLWASVKQASTRYNIPTRIRYSGEETMQQELARILNEASAILKVFRVYPSKYGGDLQRTAYIWNDSQTITPKKFLTAMNSVISKHDGSLQITFPVRLEDGSVEFKTVKQTNIHKMAKAGFNFTTGAIGSDGQYDVSASLDFSRPLIITALKQRSQQVGSCNTTKTNVKRLNNCIVKDVYTKNKNCFYQCLKDLGLAHDVPLKRQGAINPDDAIALCARNNLPVAIVADELSEDNELKIIAQTSLPYQHRIVFSTKNDIFHYYVFLDMCESKSDKKKKLIEQKRKDLDDKKKKEILVFYDLETVFDHMDDYFAKTYSNSYFSIYKDKFTETVITQENLQEFKDAVKYIKGQDVCETMVTDLIKTYNTELYKFKFISFNGSNFDDYFLLRQALKNGENINATFQSKSILGLTFQYGQCWDLKKFLTVGSLQSLCDSFKTFPQKVEGFNHEEPQLAFENGKLDAWLDLNHDMVSDYNKTDVLATYSLTQKFRQLILDITNTDVFDHLTIGSHSYNLCKSTWSPELKEALKAPLTEEDDKFFRLCLTAGRCQIMGSKTGKPIQLRGSRLSMVDVVSLYPYAMLNSLFPAGKYSDVTARDKTKLGFYEINVKQREDAYNVLPKRDFNDAQKPLDWNCKELFKTYCTSTDLDVLEEHNHWFEIIKGKEFALQIAGSVIFKSLLPFKEEKIKQDIYKEIYAPAGSYLYNVAMRETCKIYLNSLSGKVIQRNFDNITRIIRSRRELHKFMEDCEMDTAFLHMAGEDFSIANGKMKACDRYTIKRAKPSYLGVYIYAHSRKHMYNNVYSLVDAQYTDCDSCLMTYTNELKLRLARPALFEKVPHEIDRQTFLIKEFGTLDSELNEHACEADLVQPKCYWVGNRANVIKNKDDTFSPYIAKLKCKGVTFKNSGCRYLTQNTKKITPQQFRKLPATLKSNPFKLFNDLINYGSVKVACEQIFVKSLRQNDNFGIGVRYIVKELTVSQ